MAFLRIILFPFSILYGIVTFVRNKLYDWKILRQTSFDNPVISIGNLNTGGTGKSPHVEYLIRLLQDEYQIATLSRGYKRKSKGFVLADKDTRLTEIGDEPFQYNSKYDKLIVAVDEKRVRGVKKLLESTPKPDIILLDDAFQHRSIKPGFSILLTDFYDLYCNDFMLPTGSLRELRSGAKRADVIIVTKSPKVLSPITKRRVYNQLKPGDHQSMYFSNIKHGKLTRIPGIDFIPESNCSFAAILMVAGIANPYPMELYLRDRCNTFKKIIFPDHHFFKEKDIDRIIGEFENIFVKDKIIVTTEKDMLRLIQPGIIERIKDLPVCYLPIQVRIHKEDREAFNNQILEYVKNY